MLVKAAAGNHPRTARGRKCKMGSRVGGRRRQPFCGANALAKFIATATAAAAAAVYIEKNMYLLCDRPSEREHQTLLAQLPRGLFCAPRPPIPLPISRLHYSCQKFINKSARCRRRTLPPSGKFSSLPCCGNWISSASVCVGE